MSECKCRGCGKKANELEEYKEHEAKNWTADDEARSDGSYNPKDGTFLCTPCYVRVGMPTRKEMGIE